MNSAKKLEAATAVASNGMTLGSTIAVAISWSAYHSVFWCVLHGCCSWLFIFWWCIFGKAVT